MLQNVTGCVKPVTFSMLQDASKEDIERIELNGKHSIPVVPCQGKVEREDGGVYSPMS